jgi:hypothetical protein
MHARSHDEIRAFRPLQQLGLSGLVQALNECFDNMTTTFHGRHCEYKATPERAPPFCKQPDVKVRFLQRNGKLVSAMSCHPTIGSEADSEGTEPAMTEPPSLLGEGRQSVVDRPAAATDCSTKQSD